MRVWPPGVERSDPSDEIPIVDVTDLDALAPHEERLLAEDVDLEDWERRRILAVVRGLRSHAYLELLGLKSGASLRDLKRAYFELSKQFHPDRYYGRRLGSFAPLLDQVFAAVSQFVKTLSDPRTVVERPRGPGGPRRRRAERLPFSAPVAVGGVAATGFLRLETVDVGRGGAFLAREGEPPRAGQAVDLLVQPPGGDPVALRAVVVWTRSADAASAPERPPGFGVRFTDVTTEQATQLEELMASARRAEASHDPLAEPEPSGSPDQNRAVRFARGTARFELGRGTIGIDFGTTYTSVGAALANRVQILPWPDGSRAIPSAVAFVGRGQVVVGQDARIRQLRDPRHVVTSVKRLLGRSVDDPEVVPHLAQAPYEYRAASDGSILVEMFGEEYATAQLSAYLLDAARRNAERLLQRKIRQAVVTVPASFTPERVQLVVRAGQLAQLEVVDVIEEPTAAALASRHTPGFGGLIGVYDFGGGTFDFSVVEASGGDFRVLTAVGDSWLGGDDLDYAVAEAAANLFWRVHGVDLRQRAVEWQHLVLSAEKAKRDLSMVETATLFVPDVVHTAQGAQDLRIRITRDRVEPIWSPAIERSILTCTSALAVLGLEPRDLTAIYLAGGTSYVPAVRRALSDRFQVPVRVGAPPDHAVCLGAALHAAQR